MKLQRIPLEMAIALLLCSVLAFAQDQEKDSQESWNLTASRIHLTPMSKLQPAYLTCT